MPDYGRALLALIDQRVRYGQITPTKMGTVVSRETATALATVALDGSSGVPQPVKCFETVVIDVADRVGLIKFEGDWVVVADYTPRTWADQMFGQTFSTGGTTTSATFVTMPSAPSVTVNKIRDATQLQIEISVGMYSTVITTTVEVAALIVATDGSLSTDVTMYKNSFETANEHRTLHGGLTTALTLPGGGYSVTARWRRPTGTGTLTIDGNDNFMVHAKEVLP